MLRECCCGCSLKTGTIIIGIIEAVGGFVNVVLCFIAAIEANDLKNESNVLDAIDTITVTNIILGIIAALSAVLAGLLILGAKRNNTTYLVPWIVYTCFYIFAAVVSYVINTVAYIRTEEALLAGVSAFGAVLVLSIQTYFVLVVYSLYRELRGEDLLSP